MMGEQVGLDAHKAAQFDWGSIGYGELVDDGQSDGITESAMAGGAKAKESDVHVVQVSDSPRVGSTTDERIGAK